MKKLGEIASWIAGNNPFDNIVPGDKGKRKVRKDDSPTLRLDKMSKDQIKGAFAHDVCDAWRFNLPDQDTVSFYRTYLRVCTRLGLFSKADGSFLTVEEFAAKDYDAMQEIIKSAPDVTLGTKRGAVKFHQNFCNFLHGITGGECKRYERELDPIYG